MRTETKSQLLEIIRANGNSTPGKLSELLQISPQSIHRHLKDLLSRGQIIKRGSAPHVFYEIDSGKKNSPKKIYH